MDIKAEYKKIKKQFDEIRKIEEDNTLTDGQKNAFLYKIDAKNIGNDFRKIIRM